MLTSAEVAIVVYDMTSFESFEGAKKWVGELKTYGQPNVVIALAANKCDLEDYRVVSKQARARARRSAQRRCSARRLRASDAAWAYAAQPVAPW